MRSKYDDDIRKCLEYILRLVGEQARLKILTIRGHFCAQTLLIETIQSRLRNKKFKFTRVAPLFLILARVKLETGLSSTNCARTVTPTSSGDNFF